MHFLCTRQTYTADIFLAQKWKDERLRFPTNMTYNYRLLDVEWLNHIWRPDSFFKNAKSVQFQSITVPNHYVWLYRDKAILYMMKLTLQLSCAMNFAHFPHDVQACEMQIESCKFLAECVLSWMRSLMRISIDCSITHHRRIGL